MKGDHQVPAILLRSYDLSETSLILHWLTQPFGIVKTVAKGAKGKKSSFLGKLELFTVCEIHFSFSKSGSELHSLLGVVVNDNCIGVRKSYQRLLVASYFSSLLEYWLLIEQESEEIYTLTQRALNYLSKKPLEWRAITYFEKELCRLLGYGTNKEGLRKVYLSSTKLTDMRAKVEKEIKGF